jgi:hypothetical protein
VFSEIECAALMASGYASMDSQLNKLCLDVPTLDTQRQSEVWFFSPLVPVIRDQEHNPDAFRVLREHLSAGSSSVGRSLKLNRGLRMLSALLAVVAALVCAVFAYLFRHHTIATVGSVAVLALGFLLPLVFGNWIGILLTPTASGAIPCENSSSLSLSLSSPRSSSGGSILATSSAAG